MVKNTLGEARICVGSPLLPSNIQAASAARFTLPGDWGDWHQWCWRLLSSQITEDIMTQLGLARNRKSDFYIQNHYFKVLFG